MGLRHFHTRVVAGYHRITKNYVANHYLQDLGVHELCTRYEVRSTYICSQQTELVAISYIQYEAVIIIIYQDSASASCYEFTSTTYT